MTPDELRTWLLLMGFEVANDNNSLTYRKFNGKATVYCSILEPGDVNVSYRHVKTDGSADWHAFRSTPEVVFKFIKEKVL